MTEGATIAIVSFVIGFLLGGFSLIAYSVYAARAEDAPEYDSLGHRIPKPGEKPAPRFDGKPERRL